MEAMKIEELMSSAPKSVCKKFSKQETTNLTKEGNELCALGLTQEEAETFINIVSMMEVNAMMGKLLKNPPKLGIIEYIMHPLKTMRNRRIAKQIAWGAAASKIYVQENAAVLKEIKEKLGANLPMAMTIMHRVIEIFTQDAKKAI